MRVVVVGGGPSGSAIQEALLERGADGDLRSRSTGFDVLDEESPERLGRFDAIVEATGRFTLSRRAATEFFTRSTRHVAQAARRAGARHVLLSIVGCDRPEVQGYGYFAAKTAQEQQARKSSENLTIVRSTQWFEFARQSGDRMRLGPLAAVPRMTIRPVALRAVADVIADAVLDQGDRPVADVAGPEVMTLWDMSRALPDRDVRLVPVPLPGRWGRAFRDGTLAPQSDVEIVGPTFATWLAGSTGS